MIKPDCDEQPGFFLNLKFRECEKPLIEPVRARVSNLSFDGRLTVRSERDDLDRHL